VVAAAAQSLNLSPAQSTAVLPDIFSGSEPIPSEGINFALGGSLSDDSNAVAEFPGLRSQVATFSALSAISPSDPNALNVITAGGNDYNLAIVSPDASPTSLAALPEQVTDNLVDAVAALISTGATDILVANLPDLGSQPFAQTLNLVNPQGSAGLSALSTQHNLLLTNKLTALGTTSGTNIVQLDVESITNSVINNPNEFGFTNVTDSCLSDFVSIVDFGAPCSNPDEYLFWDDIHPTTRAHGLIAQLAADTLTGSGPKDPAAVPEPATAAAILLVGGSLLLRQKQRLN